MNRDVYEFLQGCDRCQRTGSLSKRDEMPQTGILEVEIFDVWGIEFSLTVSKWVEAIELPINDKRSVVSFLRKNIFERFGMPHSLVSDEGFHFCSKQFEIALAKYSVRHRITTSYHLQANGQAEVSD
ncbi:Pol polyprotein [Gossypium australe]|uniref:Pol polyprotein n=1 Tax=Gossypium australe TaxID=47621 RepID=A0A5B6UZZ0_9ROSI|nr:Pol polyprotein [Gossypium australe]